MTINLLDYSFKVLEKNDKYEFDCGDADLTEFFLKDAIPHKRQLVGVTYFFYEKISKIAIAFFTVMNDAVLRARLKNEEMIDGKLYQFYPAVKIGRLGVNKKYQRQNIGTQMLDIIKYFFIYENKTGCRFLTLDAYNKNDVLDFYQKCGFSFFTDDDSKRHTRTMKCDLKPYSDDLNARLQSSGQSTYSNR